MKGESTIQFGNGSKGVAVSVVCPINCSGGGVSFAEYAPIVMSVDYV